jgi:hypothetical protein
MQPARLLILLAAVAMPGAAHADDVNADPNDPGKVTNISKGVKEIDLGGVFVLSYDKAEGGEAQTRISTLGGIGFQYFINKNLSAGGNFLFNYDKVGDASASTFGGTVFAATHLRLGLGAFLRPSLGLGALFGTRELDGGGGMITELSQTALLVQLKFPFAYFPSKRVVLQAGPELNISLGSVKPKTGGGDSISFTQVAGGFGVGVGYAF